MLQFSFLLFNVAQGLICALYTLCTKTWRGTCADCSTMGIFSIALLHFILIFISLYGPNMSTAYFEHNTHMELYNQLAVLTCFFFGASKIFPVIYEHLSFFRLVVNDITWVQNQFSAVLLYHMLVLYLLIFQKAGSWCEKKEMITWLNTYLLH